MTPPTDPFEAARPAGGAAGEARWAERLAAAVAARESQIVLGLDPDPRRLWPGVNEGRVDLGSAVTAHCEALIDAAGEACVAVKPQLACFERLGRLRLECAGRDRRVMPTPPGCW